MGRKSRRSAAGLRNALQQKRDVQVDDIASEEEANDSELREVPMLEIPDGELTGDDVVIADENGDELTKELKIMWDAFFVAKTAQLPAASCSSRRGVYGKDARSTEFLHAADKKSAAKGTPALSSFFDPVPKDNCDV